MSVAVAISLLRGKRRQIRILREGGSTGLRGGGGAFPQAVGHHQQKQGCFNFRRGTGAEKFREEEEPRA